jgi:hypothetical protein
MDIRKELPFDVCDNCPEFVLSVDQQTLWYGDGGSHLVLTIHCKNDAICNHLKTNLNRLENQHECDS